MRELDTAQRAGVEAAAFLRRPLVYAVEEGTLQLWSQAVWVGG